MDNNINADKSSIDGLSSMVGISDAISMVEAAYGLDYKRLLEFMLGTRYEVTVSKVKPQRGDLENCIKVTIVDRKKIYPGRVFEQSVDNKRLEDVTDQDVNNVCRKVLQSMLVASVMTFETARNIDLVFNQLK